MLLRKFISYISVSGNQRDGIVWYVVDAFVYTDSMLYTQLLPQTCLRKRPFKYKEYKKQVLSVLCNLFQKMTLGHFSNQSEEIKICTSYCKHHINRG